jgi:hypothetical protein
MTTEGTDREVLGSPGGDEHAGSVPESRRRRLGALGLAVAVGAALGATGTARWEERAAEQERRAAVDLQLDAPFTFRFAAAPWESQRLDLTVHNGGPLPVTVEGLDPRRPGVRVVARRSSFPVTVRPGETGLVSLALEVTECADGDAVAGDRADLAVATADGATRDVAVFFDQPGRRVAEAHTAYCAGESGAPPPYPQGKPTPLGDAGA